MSAKKRIALVIGSGGIKCAAAAGLWRVLQEEGISVDNVVDCSGGSMYAALIANQADVKVMEEWSKTLWTSDITARVHREPESQQGRVVAFHLTEQAGG